MWLQVWESIRLVPLGMLVGGLLVVDVELVTKKLTQNYLLVGYEILSSNSDVI